MMAFPPPVARLARGAALVVSLTTAVASAADGEPAADAESQVSAGARLAAATIQVGDQYRVSAVASEPLLANPVAFCFDPQGRIFVAETHRIGRGIEDNRNHMTWLDDDLAARTVEQRREYMTRRMGDQVGRFTEASDLVRLLEDRDGDGIYESSQPFAEDFRDLVDGAAAGVMWHGDRLLFTCIPSLWELHDADGDGRAEERRALSTGYGVHVALFGHDLHGLCVGPDGRIYFSIGDRGFHVETPQGALTNTDSGAVLRCRPDGSGLEVFATGLRNPQELAFNEWGDLFTVDNNSDGGDWARVVHIVEGSQTGWRMSYQYLPDRGPFMREKIWELQNDEQPAAITPPLAHLTAGPSGLAYYPGTGLPADCDGAFFVCDFLGSSGGSGVRQFHLEPAGASYRLVRDSMFVQGVLATDCDFGPDGNFYVSDWLEGWTGTGMGRIYRVECTEPTVAAEREKVRDLLMRVGDAESSELIELLGHADMRVRSAAQHKLVVLGGASAEPLQKLVGQSAASRLARVHAIWALTALAEADSTLFDALAPLTSAADSEIRNQAARALGAAQSAPSEHCAQYGAALVALLADESPRVQCSAAISVGKLRHGPALAALLTLASENADRDPVLRHAAVMGLAGSQPAEQLVAAAQGAGLSQRLALAVALGRQRSPLVAELLGDPSERIVLEAARAIWDTPIPEANAALAKLVDDARFTSEPLLRRAVAAALADGAPEYLDAVVRCGLRTDVNATIRELAWKTVAEWAAPSPRDPVHGQWRPVTPRPKEKSIAALRAAWPAVAAADDGSGIVVAAELGMSEAFGALMQVVDNESAPAAVRARAVEAFANADEIMVMEAIEGALASSHAEVRRAGRRLLARRLPENAASILRETSESATMPERQEAIGLLAGLDAPAAGEAIAAWMQRVEQGDCPRELALEVLEAAGASDDDALAARQRAFQQRQAEAGPLAEYAVCLEGGDPVQGAQVFAAKEALSCKRCHSLKPGISMVGPSLADVGAKRTRAELLESIVRPNEKIVEGFQTTAMLLDTGLAVSGILRRENETHAVLVDPDNKEIVVDLAEVEERMQGLSAMPEDLVKHMTQRELRDLVAYMASLRDTTVGGHDAAAASAAANE